MTYQEVLANARESISKNCKACPVCNGKACSNHIPGPGSKGIGDTAMRNYDKWQDIRVNMDTISDCVTPDASLELFGKKFRFPFFAGPVGAVTMHYSDKYDDMGYKKSSFFSPQMYRELLKPFHKKAIDWAHERGMVTELHSCGYIDALVPDLVDIGLEMLNPLEIKAGMDPFRLKALYGDKLAFHGGINAQLWDNLDLVLAEMERIIPAMKEGGGYVFASDHSIPNSVSFENMKAISELAHRLGKY